jgi:hypothetical protein
MNCSWHECGRMGGVVESEKGNVKKGGCQRCYVRGVGWRRLCLRQLGVRWFSRFLFVGFFFV